jgi:uncharacterized protein YecE (DUF72 family)
MRAQELVHVGTSGWHYDHWKGPFYPDDLASKEFLTFYMDRFHTVEINNSFYRLPEEATLEMWRDKVPRGFIFSVKGSRYITHMKKLKDPAASVSTFLERVSVLRDRLGPILFQLPPRWKCNVERLTAFLNELPEKFHYAFEFRDPSWYCDATYQALADHRAAFCMYELAGHRSPREITTDFIYVRLHGPGGAYQGQYDTRVLSGWVGAFSAWAERQGKEVYCYFDNDQAGYAAQDALRLQEMLSGG